MYDTYKNANYDKLLQLGLRNLILLDKAVCYHEAKHLKI